MPCNSILTESPPDANEMCGILWLAMHCPVSAFTKSNARLDTLMITFVPAFCMCGRSDMYCRIFLSTRRLPTDLRPAASQTRLMHSLEMRVEEWCDKEKLMKNCRHKGGLSLGRDFFLWYWEYSRNITLISKDFASVPVILGLQRSSSSLRRYVCYPNDISVELPSHMVDHLWSKILRAARFYHKSLDSLIRIHASIALSRESRLRGVLTPLRDHNWVWR